MYALVGGFTNDMLSYQGKIIVHPNKAEMVYLFPKSRVVKIPNSVGRDETMLLKDHPDMAAVRFPLDKNMAQFVR